MGFFDRLFKSGTVYESKRNPSMACELTLCGGRYLLAEFDLRFNPGGGKVSLEAFAVFAEPITAQVESWIAAGSRREEGFVKFYRNSDAIHEGALFDVRFRDACCIGFRKSIHNGVPTTTVVMSIPSIVMAGEEFTIK